MQKDPTNRDTSLRTIEHPSEQRDSRRWQEKSEDMGKKMSMLYGTRRMVEVGNELLMLGPTGDTWANRWEISK